MADNRSRITKVGQHIIITDKGAFVTKAGAYAEILGDDLRVSSAGAMVEAYGTDLQVTSAGAIVEMLYSPEGTVGTNVTTRTGNRAVHARLPDEVSGYAFDPKWSWWSVIRPRESKNIVTNPSFEYNSGNAVYEAGGFTSAARDSAESPGATAGKWTYKLVYQALTAAAFIYTNGNPGPMMTGFTATPGAWTWSWDIYSTVSDFPLQVGLPWIGGGGTANVFILKAGWQRLFLTTVTVSTQKLYFLLSFLNTTPVSNILYLDRMQLENSRYPTTYHDGDMLGWNDQNINYSYYWEGVPHYSPSVRKGNTNSGGSITSLTDEVGFLTTGILGLGMHPVALKTIKLDGGKEILVDSQSKPRDFTVVGKIFGCSWQKLNDRRNKMIKLLNPQSSARRESIILRYQPTTQGGTPYGTALDIKCAYKEGLGGNLRTLYQETIPLQFRASEPAAFEDVTKHVLVTGRTTLVDNEVIFRDSTYEYQNLGTLATIGWIWAGAWLQEKPLFAGTFSQLCGDVARVVSYWDGSNWVEPNLADFIIGGAHDVATTPDGTIVLAGSFTTTNLAVTIRRVCYIETQSGVPWYTEVSNGLAGGDVRVISLSKADGSMYIGGAFTSDGPVVDTDLLRIAYISNFKTGTWSSLKGGLSWEVYDILDLEDGRVVVVGAFTSAYTALGAALPISAPYVAMWDESKDQWSTFFYTATYSGFDFDCQSVILGDDGMIYFAGIFTQDNSATLNLRGFCRWNGSAFEEVLPLNDYCNGILTNHFIKIRKDANGIIWITTGLDDGFTVPGIGLCWVFGWKDGILYPPPYYYPSPGGRFMGVKCLIFNHNNEMLMGSGDFTSNDIYVPEKITVEYEGTFETQPNFICKGEFQPSFIEMPMVNAGIYFGEWGKTIIGADERMFIRPDQAKHIIYTDARENMLSHLNLAATSFRQFKMLPNQTNIISFFAPELSVGSDFYIEYHNKFSSIDPGALE